MFALDSGATVGHEKRKRAQLVSITVTMQASVKDVIVDAVHGTVDSDGCVSPTCVLKTVSVGIARLRSLFWTKRFQAGPDNTVVTEMNGVLQGELMRYYQPSKWLRKR